MISLSALQVRTVTVCHECGSDIDCAAECKDHPDADLDEVEIIPSELPGRGRTAEMVAFAAREVLTVADTPAADRAACRMVLDENASPVLGEQVVRAYQQLRREGRL